LSGRSAAIAFACDSSSVRLDFHAAISWQLKYRLGRTSNHEPIGYERDLSGDEYDRDLAPVLLSRTVARNHHTYRQLSWATFFIDWLRTPNLKVEALSNDPKNLTKQPKLTVTGRPPFQIQEFLVVNAGPSEKEHQSQFHFAAFKAEGEPLEVLNTFRLCLKFGVIKIANVARNVREGLVRAGKATDLKADLSVMPVEGVRPFLGGDIGQWSEPKDIVWYREDWDANFKATEAGKAQTDAINRLREVENQPLHLLNTYLRKGGSTYDLLPPSRRGYLWLFFTMANSPSVFWTLSGFQGTIPGKYKLRVGLVCNERRLKEYYYDLDIRSWHDFQLSPATKA
jgi:hypothetical protein